MIVCRVWSFHLLFNCIRYMKGRTLYSEANKAIDIINQVADAKYKIVYKTKGLTDYERRKKADFAALDGKDSERKSVTHY